MGLVQRHLHKSKVTRTKGSTGSLKNVSLNSMALEKKANDKQSHWFNVSGTYSCSNMHGSRAPL